MSTPAAAYHATAAPGLIFLTVVIAAAMWLLGLKIAEKLRHWRKPAPTQIPVTGHVVAHPRADKPDNPED